MTPFSGANSATALEAAKLYVAEGFHPIPVPYRTKKPTITGWTKLRIKPEDLPKFFASTQQNRTP